MKFHHKVIEIENLSEGNFILKLDKKDIVFKAGQFFSLGIPGTNINREYSVCSGENENSIDFLIREIDEGILSKDLRKLKIGDEVKILGPYGNFYLKNFNLNENYIFIASGTGISPFMSLLKTYPKIKYQLYHGIRYKVDMINSLPKKNYFKFVSKENINTTDFFNGRITKNLEMLSKQDKRSYVFMCGNSMMVTDVYDYLINNDFKPEKIFTEIFF